MGFGRASLASDLPFACACARVPASGSSSASRDVRLRRRCGPAALLVDPVRRGTRAGAGATWVLLLVAGTGTDTSVGSEIGGGIGGGWKTGAAVVVAVDAPGGRRGLGPSCRAGGCGAAEGALWVVPASATALSGESASMRILLRGLGLAGEYACDMLRAMDFAVGNDFGVDEAGGSGGGNGCAILGTTCSGATTTPIRVSRLSVEEEDDA